MQYGNKIFQNFARAVFMQINWDNISFIFKFDQLP